MTPDVEVNPLSPAHSEILDEEHTRSDHVVDVLVICHHIVAIGIEVITKGEFEEDTLYMATLQAILAETRL